MRIFFYKLTVQQNPALNSLAKLVATYTVAHQDSTFLKYNPYSMKNHGLNF
jgi:hypothetical protein